MPCCLFAEDEALEADPEQYDCQACPVADALDELRADPENWEAWKLFRRVVTRFAVDTHLVPLALERLAGDRDIEAFGDLLERFVILYDALCPPPEPRREA